MDDLIKNAQILYDETQRVLETDKERGIIELVEDLRDDLRLFLNHSKNSKNEITENNFL